MAKIPKARGVKFGPNPSFAGRNNPLNVAGGGPKRSPQMQASSAKLPGQGKVPRSAGGPMPGGKPGRGRAMVGRALKTTPTSF